VLNKHSYTDGTVLLCSGWLDVLRNELIQVPFARGHFDVLLSVRESGHKDLLPIRNGFAVVVALFLF